MTSATVPVGDLLRDWRQRRRMSQLDLALEADVSARHLSFLETGRARPSREMVLRLAERLEVPLRDRNMMLVAAGFAPVYPERSLDAPGMRAAREAIERVLKGHEPYPAIAVDRHWTLIAFNQAIGPLLTGVAGHLLEPPVNVLRVSLHPEGLAPRIVNLALWRSHLLERLRRQVELTADPALEAMLEEFSASPYDQVEIQPEAARADPVSEFVLPFRLRTDQRILSFFSTTTLFGTPVEVTLSELAIELFFPADEETAIALQRAAKP